MVKLGLRPPTFEEMVIAGIVHPDFTKTPNKCFVGLTSYSLDGDACVPYLGGSGEDRELDGDGWDVGWSSSNRFLCVRK